MTVTENKFIYLNTSSTGHNECPAVLYSIYKLSWILKMKSKIFFLKRIKIKSTFHFFLLFFSFKHFSQPDD